MVRNMSDLVIAPVNNRSKSAAAAEDDADPYLSTLGGSVVRHELITGTPDSDIVHFEVVSFTESGRVYRHDLRSGQTTLVRLYRGRTRNEPFPWRRGRSKYGP
jgi:hypothetical protein